MIDLSDSITLEEFKKRFTKNTQGYIENFTGRILYSPNNMGFKLDLEDCLESRCKGGRSMIKSLRFCFKVDKSVGLVEDEKGNADERLICIKANDVKSYTVPGNKYKNMQEAFRNIVAHQLQCNPKMLTPITLNEYLDNTEEDE